MPEVTCRQCNKKVPEEKAICECGLQVRCVCCWRMVDLYSEDVSGDGKCMECFEETEHEDKE